MEITPGGLRRALEDALEREAREAVARHHGDPAADDPAAVLAEMEWLRSDEIDEARAAFSGEGAFSAQEAAAFEWHLARLRREVVLARSRRSIETLRVRRVEGAVVAEALESALSRHDERARRVVRATAALAAPVLVDRRREADERGGPEPAHPDAPPDDVAALAADVLGRTREPFEAARERLGLGRTPLDPFEVVRALGHREHDARFARGSRLRRLGGLLPSFTRELDQRVRPLESVTVLGLRPRALVVRPPGEVRLAVPSLERGLISEVLWATELGRALAAALASPALPASLRYPAAGSVGRALGLLVARAATDPVYLRRDRDRASRGLDEIHARGELLRIFQTRLAASSVLAVARRVSPEECAERAGAELGLTVDRHEAALAMLTPSGARHRLRALVGAERLHRALVERYDEDFLLNPRIDEPIRSATERGGLLSVEALASELGA